jgi:hypothetical protein
MAKNLYEIAEQQVYTYGIGAGWLETPGLRSVLTTIGEQAGNSNPNPDFRVYVHERLKADAQNVVHTLGQHANYEQVLQAALGDYYTSLDSHGGL